MVLKLIPVECHRKSSNGQMDAHLQTHIIVFYQLNKNKFNAVPLTPWCYNFCNRIEWLTASKAFCKSINMPHPNIPSSIVCLTESVKLIQTCKVECLAQNQTVKSEECHTFQGKSKVFYA